MEELLKAIILGAVEGFTEFLPISSTGHLLVAERLLNFQSGMGGTFAIFIQLGATLAMILYFARDLIAQVRAVRHRRCGTAAVDQRCDRICAGGGGRLSAPQVDQGSAVRVAVCDPDCADRGRHLDVRGGMVCARRAARQTQVTDAEQLSHPQALAVGLAQILALIPGVSRSGSTIVGGMFAGVSRAAATRFSFYLAIPTMLLATLFDLATSLDNVSGERLAAAGSGNGDGCDHGVDCHCVAAAVCGQPHAGAVWHLSDRGGRTDPAAARGGVDVRERACPA